jgi:hypothetical protein
VALPQGAMDALLSAIAYPDGGKPNADEIEQASQQLAIAAAAICRVLPVGSQQRFQIMFDIEMSREVVRKEPE